MRLFLVTLLLCVNTSVFSPNEFLSGSAEQQRRRWDRLTSISSTSTVSVFYVVHNFKKRKKIAYITLPLRLWTVPLKSVNGYVRTSKPFNQPRVNGVTINLLSMMHTFTFSRVVQLQIKTFDKENQCVLLIMEECLDMEHMLLEF